MWVALFVLAVVCICFRVLIVIIADVYMYVPPGVWAVGWLCWWGRSCTSPSTYRMSRPRQIHGAGKVVSEVQMMHVCMRVRSCIYVCQLFINFCRIDKLSHSRDKNLILYHFVGCLGSCSADPGVIFRRLLKKVTEMKMCTYVRTYSKFGVSLGVHV